MEKFINIYTSSSLDMALEGILNDTQTKRFGMKRLNCPQNASV